MAREAELAAQDKIVAEARSKAVTAVGDRTRPKTTQPKSADVDGQAFDSLADS